MDINSKMVIIATSMPAMIRSIDNKTDMVTLITFERKHTIVHKSLLRNMRDYEHTYQTYIPGTKVLAKDQSRIIRLLKENN